MTVPSGTRPPVHQTTCYLPDHQAPKTTPQPWTEPNPAQMLVNLLELTMLGTSRPVARLEDWDLLVRRLFHHLYLGIGKHTTDSTTVAVVEIDRGGQRPPVPI
jgi:hypothetical protein